MKVEEKREICRPAKAGARRTTPGWPVRESYQAASRKAEDSNRRFASRPGRFSRICCMEIGLVSAFMSVKYARCSVKLV